MTVDTYVNQALTRVTAEREAVVDKRDALDQFRKRVERIDADPTPTSAPRVTATTALEHRTSAASDERCRSVRRAFAETLRPHSIDDVDDAESESLLETVRAEFTDQIAVGLAPMTETPFTPELKRTVLAETDARRRETSALDRALEREAGHLEDVAGTVDELVDWLADVNETPLLQVGFDELRQRHETLADHRDRCDSVARNRQEFLERTTNNGVEAGVRHRSLIPYLYQDFPVDHPVLATVATLDEACQKCQRTVRDHLVRRA